MSTFNLRLTGPAGSVDAMLDVLRGSPGVDRVVELGATEMPRASDDSSSAGLSDDVAANAARDVEVHADGEAATETVRDRVELAGSDAGVVVEWRDTL